MADEKKQADGAENQEKQESAAAAKKKKISRMSVIEIECELKNVQEKMGGMGSHYAQQLLKRKNALKLV